MSFRVEILYGKLNERPGPDLNRDRIAPSGYHDQVNLMFETAAIPGYATEAYSVNIVTFF